MVLSLPPGRSLLPDSRQLLFQFLDPFVDLAEIVVNDPREDGPRLLGKFDIRPGDRDQQPDSGKCEGESPFRMTG